VAVLVHEREMHAEEARMAFFATQITRIVRGFLSRIKHNFFERRRTIEKRRLAGVQLREQLQHKLDADLERRAMDEEHKAREEFVRATQGLHHLVSTQAQPGVFNPRYALSDAEIPSAFGVPFEDHLRSASKTFLRSRGLSSQRWPKPPTKAELTAKKALVELGGPSALRVLEKEVGELERTGKLRRPRPSSKAGASGDLRERATAEDAAHLHQSGIHGFEATYAALSRQNRAAVPSESGGAEKDLPGAVHGDRRSLQASAPFNVEIEAQRMDSRHSRVRAVSPNPFVSGGKVPPPRPPQGVLSSAPFEEAWKAARSVRELDNTAESKMLRVSQQPFVAAGGRHSSFEEVERKSATPSRKTRAIPVGSGAAAARALPRGKRSDK
jgi:hypothetical protein